MSGALDSGQSWSITSAPQSYVWVSVASSADGSQLIALPSDGPIFISKDSGATWVAASAPAGSWTQVACSAEGKIIIASHRGDYFTGLWKSSDFGLSWHRELFGYNYGAVVSSADGNKLAVTDYSGILTWQSIPAPELSIIPSNQNFLLSWTIPSLNFALQQNPDFTSTNWADVPGTATPNYTNLKLQVSIPAPPGKMFYRLKDNCL